MNLVLSFLLPELIADIPTWYIAGFVSLIGAFVGSFLNVVIHRVPQDETEERDVVFKPSHCPVCKAAIKPYDNIPVISYLLLGGRCRSCKTRISPRYVAVEVITGVLWLLVFLHHLGARGGVSWLLACDIALVTALVALIFIDSEHQILPDVITYPCLIFALLARIALPLWLGPGAFEDLSWFTANGFFGSLPLVGKSLAGGVLGALAGGGSLWLMGWLWEKLRGVEAMGLGDVKMMLGVGAYLGFRMTLVTLFLAALSGSVIGIALMIKNGERNLQMKLPFGIFLGLGAILCILAGPPLLDWYLSNFR
jgi:leader peptidase (prepilin peptidase)/N-methyltransferase